MPITESQLETWSHLGAVTTSQQTYASIRGILTDSAAPLADLRPEVFLQGSYGNDTNVRADSDVDVAFMVTAAFRSNSDRLSIRERMALEQSYFPSTLDMDQARADVLQRLQATFGVGYLQNSTKCVKVIPRPGRLGADIVVCMQYRDYNRFVRPGQESFDEGILIRTTAGVEIVNYPKLHSERCTEKHQSTAGWFKPVVRMFKNMRGRAIEEGLLSGTVAPSYFVEGVIYNVPDRCFGSSLQETFCSCVNWLTQADCATFVCPNGKLALFGSDSTQWSVLACTTLLNSLTELWNSR